MFGIQKQVSSEILDFNFYLYKNTLNSKIKLDFQKQGSREILDFNFYLYKNTLNSKNKLDFQAHRALKKSSFLL